MLRNNLIGTFFSIIIPLGFKLRVSNVGSPACDNNVSDQGVSYNNFYMDLS